MKPIFFLFLAIIPNLLHAATWTVDNNAARPADFRTIQDGIDAASIGDTLLIAGSGTFYNGFTVTKRLNIKGPGNTVVGGGPARINGLVTLTSVTDPTSVHHGRAASGSVLESLIFYTGGSNLIVETTCSNVTLKRLANFGEIQIRGGSGSVVIGCWINQLISAGATNLRVAGSRIELYLVSPTGDNQIFENCIIGAKTNVGPPLAGSSSILNYPVFRNTIFVSGTPVGSAIYSYQGAQFDHCMAIGYAALPIGNGNVSLAHDEYQNVFVDFDGNTNTSDKEINSPGFRLKPGSPAIGAGKNGMDLGIFSGTAPYVIGVIPGLPRITEIILPAVAPDSVGLTFEVHAEARD
ncbi:MAG: hypothetical protein EOP87_00695 [Verrucomicrobiaceae bacterium]|nr:MAG: hypothetical protein EOP87_00695 [Verrucomicrobiaceae bacterium]